MTDKEILKLAKKIGFSVDADDGTWFCFEEEILKFAWEIYGIASDETLQDYESKF